MTPQITQKAQKTKSLYMNTEPKPMFKTQEVETQKKSHQPRQISRIKRKS